MSRNGFAPKSNMETIIPAALLVASAISYLDPNMAPCLFFLFAGLGFLINETLIKSSQKTMVRHISDGITLSMVEFSQDSQKAENFTSALSETIRVALTNDKLTKTFRDIAIESMRNEDLQSDILDTISNAMVRVSEDETLRKATLSAIEQGISHTLADKAFMDAMYGSLVSALVLTSQNEELQRVLLTVVTEAISSAVRDEQFMEELKQAMKECLRDSEIFRAGASGLLGAVLPSRKNNDKTTTSDSKTSGGSGRSSSLRQALGNSSTD